MPPDVSLGHDVNPIVWTNFLWIASGIEEEPDSNIEEGKHDPAEKEIQFDPTSDWKDPRHSDCKEGNDQSDIEHEPEVRVFIMHVARCKLKQKIRDHHYS